MKEILGTPSSSGFDDMEAAEYISYTYGETNVTFYSEDEESPVSFIHILSGQVYN